MTDYLMLAREALAELRDQQVVAPDGQRPRVRHEWSTKEHREEPEDAGPLTPSQWKARELNHLFEEQGATKRPSFILPQTVEDGELKRRWQERWPEKPYGKVDEESTQWAREMLTRAGTDIVWVNGERCVAVWPEWDGPEYHLALKLLELDGHKLHYPDNPEIERPGNVGKGGSFHD